MFEDDYFDDFSATSNDPYESGPCPCGCEDDLEVYNQREAEDYRNDYDLDYDLDEDLDILDRYSEATRLGDDIYYE